MYKRIVFICNRWVLRIVSILFLLLMIAPVWLMITGSFMGRAELSGNLAGILSDGDGFLKLTLLPQYPTIKPYTDLLFIYQGFLHVFWNSCRQVFPVLFGYLLIALPAAWAFARFDFPLKRFLFFLYVILMIMPFQVTMVSNYLVLGKTKLMDTDWAIILPAAFSTFPVFIMTKFFASIPKPLLEAAKTDGAKEWQIYLYIGIPLGVPGVIAALVLGFIENWNAIEQPMLFLKTVSKWPVTLILPGIIDSTVGIAIAASVITMLPSLLFFLDGQSYLIQGLQAAGLKD